MVMVSTEPAKHSREEPLAQENAAKSTEKGRPTEHATFSSDVNVPVDTVNNEVAPQKEPGLKALPSAPTVAADPPQSALNEKDTATVATTTVCNAKTSPVTRGNDSTDGKAGNPGVQGPPMGHTLAQPAGAGKKKKKKKAVSAAAGSSTAAGLPVGGVQKGQAGVDGDSARDKGASGEGKVTEEKAASKQRGEDPRGDGGRTNPVEGRGGRGTPGAGVGTGGRGAGTGHGRGSVSGARGGRALQGRGGGGYRGRGRGGYPHGPYGNASQPPYSYQQQAGAYSPQALPSRQQQGVYFPQPQPQYLPAHIGTAVRSSLMTMNALEAREYLASMAVQQIEYYFSVDNLCRDTYLRAHLDEEGWVPLALICNFPTVASFAADYSEIVKTLQEASSVLEYDEANETLRLKEKATAWLLPNGRGGMGCPRWLKQAPDTPPQESKLPPVVLPNPEAGGEKGEVAEKKADSEGPRQPVTPVTPLCSLSFSSSAYSSSSSTTSPSTSQPESSDDDEDVDRSPSSSSQREVDIQADGNSNTRKGEMGKRSVSVVKDV